MEPNVLSLLKRRTGLLGMIVPVFLLVAVDPAGETWAAWEKAGFALMLLLLPLLLPPLEEEVLGLAAQEMHGSLLWSVLLVVGVIKASAHDDREAATMVPSRTSTTLILHQRRIIACSIPNG